MPSTFDDYVVVVRGSKPTRRMRLMKSTLTTMQQLTSWLTQNLEYRITLNSMVKENLPLLVLWVTLRLKKNKIKKSKKKVWKNSAQHRWTQSTKVKHGSVHARKYVKKLWTVPQPQALSAQRWTQLTQSTFDNDVAVLGVPSRVETPHLDAVLRVWLEVRKQVRSDILPLKYLPLKILLWLVRLVVDVEPADGVWFHWMVLYKQKTRSTDWCEGTRRARMKEGLSYSNNYKSQRQLKQTNKQKQKTHMHKKPKVCCLAR